MTENEMDKVADEILASYGKRHRKLQQQEQLREAGAAVLVLGGVFLVTLLTVTWVVVRAGFIGLFVGCAMALLGMQVPNVWICYIIGVMIIAILKSIFGTTVKVEKS